VPAVTVFAFSQENWKRDRGEVDQLMALLERTLRDELPALVREGVRVSVMAGTESRGSGSRGDMKESAHPGVPGDPEDD
jgi:undecaprenyl diphosphate synthase